MYLNIKCELKPKDKQYTLTVPRTAEPLATCLLFSLLPHANSCLHTNFIVYLDRKNSKQSWSSEGQKNSCEMYVCYNSPGLWECYSRGKRRSTEKLLQAVVPRCFCPHAAVIPLEFSLLSYTSLLENIT